MLMSVKIIPNAKQTEVVGWEGKVLKIRIAAPATEGKANKELLRFVAKLCDCAPSEVEILKGQTAKQKILDVPAMPDLQLTNLN
ncbi:YggU family protein [Candidatus Uhrbacteria bacterium]|nr:YggU family protein [Candidatus Uhrbacteria bacterium]